MKTKTYFVEDLLQGGNKGIRTVFQDDVRVSRANGHAVNQKFKDVLVTEILEVGEHPFVESELRGILFSEFSNLDTRQIAEEFFHR